jgi:hypothetical protein
VVDDPPWADEGFDPVRLAAMAPEEIDHLRMIEADMADIAADEDRRKAREADYERRLFG